MALPNIECRPKNDVSELHLFLEFDKGFDTLEWPFIHKSLHHFGFGLSEIIKSGKECFVATLKVAS